MVRPTPPRALERQPRRDRSIDVGEFIWLDVAVRLAGTREDAEVRRDLLLRKYADPASAIVATNGGDIGGPACDLRQQNRIFEASHTTATEKTVDRDFTRQPPQLMAVFDFADPLKLPVNWATAGARSRR